MILLITGVHGFVGSNLVKTLKENHIIYGLDILSPDKEGVISTFSWDDICDNLVPPMDTIIHLAGKAHDTKNQSETQAYFNINTGLTLKIYDHFLNSSATKFIFFSSVKAVADSVSGDVLTEEVASDPKGPYGESKMLAEKYILDHLPGKDSGKSVYILRPCMIHGPGNKGNLTQLYKVISEGIPWPLGAFENRRSFTSIDNLCFVIDKLISEEIIPGIYNMADDEALSTNELIEVICHSLGRKPHIWHIPQGVMNGLARLGRILHLPLNTERLRKLTENYVVSNKKIKNALRIDKMPVSARDGLGRTIRSFK